MSALTIRRLRVDLDTPLPRHWNGGDAFRTALFNALSMSFPAGEQVFIDSVRKGLSLLDADRRARFAEEAKGFIGQEATHRRIHQRFNEHLERQGLVNHWEPRIRRRIARLDRLAPDEPRAWLAVTAATEHLTAILSEHLLTHASQLADTQPRLRDLWLWHASEESEHRSTAFDLYRALGGNEKWRRRMFKLVSWHFATDLLRQTVHNLWRDGTLWQRSTWASAWTTLFGTEGLVRCHWRAWRRYLDADFHPLEVDGRLAERWLLEHADLAPPVTPSATPPTASAPAVGGNLSAQAASF
jgi:predicted metal-dependent hydrolase